MPRLARKNPSEPPIVVRVLAEAADDPRLTDPHHPDRPDWVMVSIDAWDALGDRLEDLSDRLAIAAAEGQPNLPVAVADAINRGAHPVRAWREHRGWTARELAERAHVSASYIIDVEGGRKPGSTRFYRALAVALGTSIELLVPDDATEGAAV